MRWRQNFRTTDQNKLRRAQGFKRLLWEESPYNNQDFHDQLLHLTTYEFATIRQPVTLLFESESSRKQKSLFVGTEGAIFKLNNTTGNYEMLGAGFGKESGLASGPRFKAARQGDYVLFTNDYNPPQYHILEQGYPSSPPYVQPIPDLETIGLSKARHVWVWKNVVFFADVEMDQGRFPFRIVWGDFDNPTSFDPEKAESIAGYKDLNANEQILGGLALGNVFLIYTTHGIWEMSVVGGDESFQFREAYPGNRSDFLGCLHYPGTLVNLGDSHLYLGKDKIYVFNPYQQAPEAPEWLHKASKKIFDEIDRTVCGVHISHLNVDEIYICYADENAIADCPNHTIRINKRYQVVDYMDFGATALVEFTPGSSSTIRDFILNYDICTAGGLDDEGYLFNREGLPVQVDGEAAAFVPQVVHTHNPIHLLGSVTVADAGTTAANGTYTYNPYNGRYEKADGHYIFRSNPGHPDYYGIETLVSPASTWLYSNPLTLSGAWSIVLAGAGPAPTVTPSGAVITVEDYNQVTSDGDSLCFLLGGQRLDDICRVCPEQRLFIAASSEDWCLKQMNVGFARERCTNPTATGSVGTYGYSSSVGAYISEGYDSILRFAPLYNKDGDVIMERFQINYIAMPPEGVDPIPEIELFIGVSGQPVDQNSAPPPPAPGSCGIIWHQRSSKQMTCLSQKTAAQHASGQTQPYSRADWTFWHTGHYLYVELRIEGVGADVEFSGVAGDVSLKGVRNA